MSNCVVNLLKTTAIKTTAIKTTAIGIGFCLVATQSAIAAETYKLEIQEKPSESAQMLQGETYKRVLRQSEWAVLKVTDSNTIQFHHARRTTTNYGVSKWKDNPVTMLAVCPITSGDCVTLPGNQFTIPKSKNIKDFKFEFQFVENDVKQVRFVQVPSDRIPEIPSRGNSRSASPKK